ncbi:MAG: DUF3488 and DUF4129 domain-containing transglutaminase family protein [Candidatus Korobacteraceae bacterium]
MMASLPVATAATAPRSPEAALVERYFQGSLFLLVATGFATLAGTGKLDIISVVGVSLALGIRAILLIRNHAVVIPERWTSIGTMLYLLFFALDFLLLSRSYVTASVHLVLFSMVVKLFSIQRERDHLYLIILSFLSVLSASVLTVDTTFLISFCLFFVIAVVTFLSMEIRRSLAAAGSGPRSLATPASLTPLTHSLSAVGILLSVGTLVTSLGLFFLLPRLSAGYLSSYSPRNEFVSGFSESVELGEIGRIKQSNTVVMHIELNESESPAEKSAIAGADLKWRGVALTHFDGSLWYNPADQLMEIATGAGGRFDLWRPQLRKSNAAAMNGEHRFHPLRYRVVMEPVGTNVLFLAPVAASVQSRIRELGIDANGSVYNLDRRRITESYEATSMLPHTTPGLLRNRSGDAPPEVVAAYTQLPEELDPRIRELAQRVTSTATTDYDKTVAIENYLTSNLGYSLQMAASRPRDPLAYFLFERKEGHCEYFASSMAVLLRTLGIPSRIVNGFRAGEFNDLTGKYIIRGRDAHSWVEVFLPAYGWVSFDPTPPDPSPSRNTWARLLLYLDAGREFWREWVINYDFLHQRTLSTTVSRKSHQIAEDVRLWARHHYQSLVDRARSAQERASQAPLRWGAMALLALALVVLLLNLRRILRGVRNLRLARDPAHAPQAAASLWYQRMTRTLARRGLSKQPTMTPAEFVEAIAEPDLRKSVATFTEHYERARFGDSPEHARRLPELYEEVAGIGSQKR